MNALTKQFVEELEELPEALQAEALDFVQFLKAKLDRQDPTEYLLSNPTNKTRLLSAVADLEAGKGVQRHLIDA